jgi:hypothetical protein
MKFPLACFTLLLSLGNIFAAPLTQADREALLDDLEKMREAADSRVDERYRTALNSFRSAMSSSEKALELYLNCVEKVDFEEQKKTNQEFREWKRKEEGRLSRPAFRTALRYQLSWLVLTLQANSKKPDRPKLLADAATSLSALFADAKELAKEQKTLEEEVTSTVFARAYKVEHAKAEKWPLSPVAIDKIFNDILLPPLRNPERLPALKEAWLRRIQLETLKREFWSGGGQGTNGPESGPNPETTKFLTDERPKLQWEMEKDLFKSGDESGAAVRMLAHIQNNLTHPSAREWGQEFKTLLAPDAPAAKAP